MDETIKIEIEITAPPEGWGEVEYRHVASGDEEAMFFNGTRWMSSRAFWTDRKVPVARKLAPLWTPPPQWHAMFGDCWLTVDSDREVKLFRAKPRFKDGLWSSDSFGLRFDWDMIMPDMLPPASIPSRKCCFKIGSPKE